MNEPSILELYILSCLNQGMKTSYDLLRDASLSLGASTPALKRLVNAGKISRKDKKGSTARPRFEYALTTKGTDALQLGIAALLATSGGDQDIDSILRIVDMAKRHGAAMMAISTFLKGSAEHRQRLSKHAAVDSDYQDWEYPILRRRVDAARLQAEAKELTDMARRAESSKSRRAKQPESMLSPSPRVARKAHKAF